MRWATDNPDLFAIMEKTRMYIAGAPTDFGADTLDENWLLGVKTSENRLVVC